MTTPRDDFFTLIHKAIRRELFATTMLAATTDWRDEAGRAAFEAHWRRVHHLLEIHSRHEDEHFFPLLRDRAPQLLSRMEAEHAEQNAALADLAEHVRVALASPADSAELEVHRHLSRFVAGYLPHLLAEETAVMPAIWEHCTDEHLARARAAFLAAMPPEDATLSRRVILPAISPAERAAVLGMLQAAAPAPLFEAALDDARQLLEPADWARLRRDLGAGRQAGAGS